MLCEVQEKDETTEDGEKKGDEEMDTTLIYEGKATIADLLILHVLGYEFVIGNGVVTDVIYDP